MGCSCQSSPSNPEYKEIYDFFYQMSKIFPIIIYTIDKTNAFTFKMDNYYSLMDQITKQSANNFKKLEKKQSVRLGFIRQVAKLFNVKGIEKDKEEHNVNKLLFFIIVLHITLKKFIEESQGIISLEQQNDIEQSLINISVNALNKQFTNPNHLSLIIFYSTKLLTSLIQHMKEIDNYLSIEQYVSLIKGIDERKGVKEEDKSHYTLAVGIFIGSFFSKTKAKIQRPTVSFIIHFFQLALFYIKDFILNNYDGLKDHHETLQSNSTYASFQSLIINNFLVFKSESCDVALGKNLLIEMESSIHTLYSEPNQNHKIMELLLIEMFKQCSTTVTKILITSMFEFISEKIAKDISLRFYYDILCSYCHLIVTDEILNERGMRMFASIFIEEISIETSAASLNSIKYRDNMFIDKLCESIFNKLSSPKVFFSLLLSISIEVKDIEISPMKIGEEVRKRFNVHHNILQKITMLIDSYFQSFEVKKKEPLTINTLITLIRRYYPQDDKLKMMYAKLYESIINFAMRFFEIDFNDFGERKGILNAIVSFIYDYEVYNQKDDHIYINDIISLMATLESFITHYSKGCFQDAYLIFKLLSLIFKQYCRETNLKSNHSSIFLLYQVGMGILCIMQNVFQLPLSLSLIHTEVFTGINGINNTLANQLNEIIVSYSSQSEVFYLEMKNKILYSFSKNSPVISYELFSQYIDLIYSKIFGYSSSLNAFFEGEIKTRQLAAIAKEINEDNHLWDSIGTPRRKETDIITEGNITTLLDHADDINDISVHIPGDDKITDTKREEAFFAESANGINKPNVFLSKNIDFGIQKGHMNDYFGDNKNKTSKIKL